MLLPLLVLVLLRSAKPYWVSQYICVYSRVFSFNFLLMIVFLFQTKKCRN